MHKTSLIHYLIRLLTILTALFLVSACSPAQVVPAIKPSPLSTNIPVEAPSYKVFKVHSPVPASFELPVEWDFWGNAGWLSPDDGQTCAGLRMTLIKPGQDARRLLFNEDAIILDQNRIKHSQIEVNRYKIGTYFTNAATGERVLDGYELIYAFPANDPEQMAGVFVRASTLEELDSLEPIVEHMADSLLWDPK
jgi:hypothetical protein